MYTPKKKKFKKKITHIQWKKEKNKKPCVVNSNIKQRNKQEKKIESFFFSQYNSIDNIHDTYFICPSYVLV